MIHTSPFLLIDGGRVDPQLAVGDAAVDDKHDVAVAESQLGVWAVCVGARLKPPIRKPPPAAETATSSRFAGRGELCSTFESHLHRSASQGD